MNHNKKDTQLQNKTTPPAKRPVLNWLLRILQGAIIGAGAILPGISGGVLCVVFGIYQPMMALLAHPFRTFKKYVWLLLPVLIGWAIGFLGIARVLNLLFSNTSYSTPATWLFVGLIAGMMPQLYREAGKQGRTKKSWISLIVSTALVLTLLILLQYGTRTNIEPNIWWYFVCGILWGISLVAPGLSSSSILLFLGLYQTMTAGLTVFSLEVIIPMAIGVIAVVFLSARGINYMFDRHYSSSFHGVLGFVIASTIAVILPASGSTGASGEVIGIVYTGDISTILIWALCFIVGFLFAWLMDRLGRKVQPKMESDAVAE